MIRAYKYINTVHTKLNEYVLAFFRKIETDTNGFNDNLFESEFLPLVNRHPKILKNRFKAIYEHAHSLSPRERRLFCQKVIESNEIEKICRGEYRPIAFTSHTIEIGQILKDLFHALYKQVLDGPPFQQIYHTTLRDHFNQFCDTNKDITLCPTCGIGKLKKSQDEFRDQYDHYLPISLYPFSSVNFYNLVPCCMECNSFYVKGDKDTIEVSTGKLFFPYDGNHKGITLRVSVSQDNPNIEQITWILTFSNADNKNEEIESWKTIYSIENRYQAYIKININNWYKMLYQLINHEKMNGRSPEAAQNTYFKLLELEELSGLDFIKKPALEGLFSDSTIMQAQLEALKYSK